jgi:hypothetical protein
MNDPKLETREEPISDKGALSNKEGGERLTTKDMAAGVASRRALEKSDIATDSRGTQPREPGKIQHSEAQHSEAEAQPAAPLFDSSETEKFRSHWTSIQSQFVDEPRKSVEQADELVATTMKRLAEVFAAEREKLEREWDSGEDISTEDLRIALQKYRSFFDRLLSV